MRLIVIIFFMLVSFGGHSQNQMYQWEMDTYKNAEKARKWRSTKTTSKLWARKRKSKPSWIRRREFTYGQPTKIRHKGVR
jgi:hypothetical protein